MNYNKIGLIVDKTLTQRLIMKENLQIAQRKYASNGLIHYKAMNLYQECLALFISCKFIY